MKNTLVNENSNNKPKKKREKRKKEKFENLNKANPNIHLNPTIIKKHTFMNDPLMKSVTSNYIFYITSLICLFIISKYSKRSFIFTIITFIIASFAGFVIHYVSHAIRLEEEYVKNDNYITRNKYLNKIAIFSCKLLDFHDIIHHDSSINKTTKNIIYEFLLNFLTQGGFGIIIYYITKKLNGYIFLMWGLLYCTIHIINYNIVPSDVHMKHHLDKNTNYGVDIWDILFRTKYNDDPNEIELINHYSFNVIIITVIIVLLIKYNIFKFL
jgi:hypothetical protein